MFSLIDGINFNEGGHFFTFFWSRRHRMVRIYFKPDFWRPSARGLFERIWRY